MVRVLVAAIVAMMASIVVAPTFIEYLRRNEMGQHIREEGPQGHVTKQGTPTMGGLLILLCAMFPFLALSHYTLASLTVAFIAVGCGLIGFLDDFIKFRHSRSLGLAGRWKLVLLALITVVTGFLAHHYGHYPTWVYIPGIGHLQFGPFWYLLLFFIIAGSANGVNLTDGLDGLASGTGIISLFTFMAMSVIAFIRSSPSPGLRSTSRLDLALLAAALIGGLIGFLWYNAFPAEIFMGDTGSMAIGGALAGFAIMTKTEFLLLLIGGIYLIEALSVMIQVFTFKYLGRRVFLMAPIHHHFEMKAWSETKIMVRFWILGGIFCASAFALFYRFFVDFSFKIR
jgi:phospho-N-acetylmuramoyl-pentapeptide-transferase